MKPVILTFTGYYLPGYRGGGSIRTIANMVDQLSSDFEFRIVTHDRDMGDARPYAGVIPDQWVQVGKAKVFYSSPSRRSWKSVLRLAQGTPHDLLYLHGFFDAEYTVPLVLMSKYGLIPNCPVVIAPRGEFSDGAYRLKRWKKAPFVALARMTGVYNNVIWHASTSHEVADIQRVLGAYSSQINKIRNIAVAPDQVEKFSSLIQDPAMENDPLDSALRVCFLSRISSKKNLEFALNVLRKVRVPVSFNIYGPVEDQGYWSECQKLVAEIPGHIRVHYGGSVEHALVRSTIAQHDVFFLPTRGENFGHVFLEAWSAGVPVLVSDQTPWRDLAGKQLGWDIPLDQPDRFVAALEQAASWDETEAAHIRDHCREFAAELTQDQGVLEKNRHLFLDALGLRGERVVTDAGAGA